MKLKELILKLQSLEFEKADYDEMEVVFLNDQSRHEHVNNVGFTDDGKEVEIY